MKTLLSVSAALALALVAGSCAGGEPSPDGLKVGDGVGAFQVVKAGGVDDGVEAGAKLCYL